MEILKDGSISISAPQDGIGVSYLDTKKAKNIQCLDISSVPGACLANYEAINMMEDYLGTYAASTCTAAVTDLITVSITKNFVIGLAVKFTTTGTLPAPLSSSTTYYVSYVSGNTIKVATSLANATAGTHVDITDTGSGTHSIVATELGTIRKIVQNPGATTANFKYFAIDSTGKLWTQYGNIWSHLPGNSAGEGEGLEIWKGYLFSATSTKIEVYGPLTGTGDSASWSTSWQTLDSDAQFHPMIVASNDRLYVGAANYIAELLETSGSTFAPGTGATFTYTQKVLTLPAGYRVKTLAELSGDLAIGTWKGNDLDTYAMDYKVADIFFWDKSSTLSFRRPVQLYEHGVNQMITVGNTLYAVAGYDGRIFATDGVNVTQVGRIPDALTNTQQSSISLWFWPNAIMHHRGRIYIGVSSSATGTIAPLGVYSFDPKTGNICVENILSSNNDGSSGRVVIGALLSAGAETYYIGVMADASKTYQGGINIVKPANGRYETGAFFETGLMQVGTLLNKKTYTNVDLLFGKALSTDQGIKLYYRTASVGSYTLLGTFNYASLGAVTNSNVNIVLEGITTAQFKVEVIPHGTQDSPEFIGLVIHP
jgi:hypothetical protein